MENVEEQLKKLIQLKFKSLRDFSIQIGMPYSTMDSIFKRGLKNASVINIIKICNALNISTDDLSQGKIVNKIENAPVQTYEGKYIEFIELLGKLSPEQQIELKGYIKHMIDSTGANKQA